MLSGLQMAFFKGMGELFKGPPAWLRMPAKRGTFFRRLDPNREPSSALPKLMKRCLMIFSRLLDCGATPVDLPRLGAVAMALLGRFIAAGMLAPVHGSWQHIVVLDLAGA